MAAYSAIELDPVLVKAIFLLHSREKDSSEKLRSLLEDTVKNRGTRSSQRSAPSQSGTKRIAAHSHNKASCENGSKRGRLESSSAPTIRPSVITSPHAVTTTSLNSAESECGGVSSAGGGLVLEAVELERSITMSSGASRANVSSAATADDDQLTMEILELEMGLHCAVCKNMEVGSRNQLVECQDCHKLYHQECHKPVIRDDEFSDPRVVWYCSGCSKTIKRIVVRPHSAVKSSPSRKSPIPPVNAHQHDTDASSTAVFKRSDVKQSSSGGGSSASRHQLQTSSAASGSGMAALAASLKPKPSSSATHPFAAAIGALSSKHSESSGKACAPIPMSSLEKKLQIMKKKAANKLQEKKKLPKL